MIATEATRLLNTGKRIQIESAATLLMEADFEGHVPSPRPALFSHVWSGLKKSGSPLAKIPHRLDDAERGPRNGYSFDPTEIPGTPVVDEPTPDLISVPIEQGHAFAAFESFRGCGIQNIFGWRGDIAPHLRSNRHDPGDTAAVIRPTRELARRLAEEFEPLQTLPGLYANKVEFASALRQVLYVAVFGGAYDNGFGGAFGRVRAWKTIGFLAHCSEHAPFEQVRERASKCTWISFRIPWFSGHGWFANSCAQGCVASIDESGTSVSAVLWADWD